MSGPAKGKKGMYVELPEAELTELREFCKRRGAKIAEEVRLAIRRHMANPPPLPEHAPLPPMPTPTVSEPAPATQEKPAAKGKAKKPAQKKGGKGKGG